MMVRNNFYDARICLHRSPQTELERKQLDVEDKRRAEKVITSKIQFAVVILNNCTLNRKCCPL